MFRLQSQGSSVPSARQNLDKRRIMHSSTPFWCHGVLYYDTRMHSNSHTVMQFFISLMGQPRQDKERRRKIPEERKKYLTFSSVNLTLKRYYSRESLSTYNTSRVSPAEIRHRENRRSVRNGSAIDVVKFFWMSSSFLRKVMNIYPLKLSVPVLFS